MLRSDELKQGIKLKLVRAPEDPSLFSLAFQKYLMEILADLRYAGVQLTPIFFTADANGAAGGVTGEITVLSQTLGDASTILAAYLTGGSGRKVRLKFDDDVEVEARTPKELERLLARARHVTEADGARRIVNG